MEKIIGNPQGLISDLSAAMGSNRIEIPQGDAGEITVGFTMISQYLLHHRLGLAIRIRRSDCVLFRIRQI